MTMKLAAAALATALMIPAAMPTTAVARDRYYDDHRYHGRDRYYRHCRHSNGTTGTIAGGVGGAVIGNALGGGTLGTLAGAGGGALLGRHLDKKHDEAQNRRNGC